LRDLPTPEFALYQKEQSKISEFQNFEFNERDEIDRYEKPLIMESGGCIDLARKYLDPYEVVEKTGPNQEAIKLSLKRAKVK